MKSYSTVLAIAGSDSGGGAGIQADIKTVTAIGCFATTAVTALTAQNTQGVQKIEKISAAFVSEQINSVLTDIGADCIKIGMLQNKEVMLSVSESLSQFPYIPVVLDPVMVATSGDCLLEQSAIEILRKILNQSVLVTPNKHEAEILSGTELSSPKKIQDACKEIARYGAENVLIKGGDFDDESSTDTLYIKKDNRFIAFESPRIDTKNTHGTGCTYSSAIASYLAKGHDLEQSIRLAKEYILNAIKSGAHYSMGKGRGPVDHSWAQNR